MEFRRDATAIEKIRVGVSISQAAARDRMSKFCNELGQASNDFVAEFILQLARNEGDEVSRNRRIGLL
jgi:hypothetical protein